MSGKPPATLLWLAQVSDVMYSDPDDEASLAAREAITYLCVGARMDSGQQVGVVHEVVVSELEEWGNVHCQDGGRRRVRDYLVLMPSRPVSLLMQEYRGLTSHTPCCRYSLYRNKAAQ